MRASARSRLPPQYREAVAIMVTIWMGGAPSHSATSRAARNWALQVGDTHGETSVNDPLRSRLGGITTNPRLTRTTCVSTLVQSAALRGHRP